MTPPDAPDRKHLLAESGFDPNLAYAVKSFPVERSVVFEPSAGKPSLVKLPGGRVLSAYGNSRSKQVPLIRWRP